jgi:O-antigen/teichoic acid export membrane protein
VRRAGWAIGDQALSSLTNFALVVLVARSVSPAAFGGFSLAFGVYLLVLQFCRAIATEPLLVRAGEDRHAWSVAVGSATGMCASIAGVAGVICLGVGWLVGGPFGNALLGLGLTLPGLLVQDSWRYAFFARRRGVGAFTNDFIWALSLAAAIGVVRLTHQTSVLSFVLAWGLSATVAACFGVVQARVLPKPTRTLYWWRQQRELSSRYMGEFASGTAAARLSDFGVGGVAGLAAVGALRGGQVLVGPLNVLVVGTRLVGVPEGVEMLRRSPRRLLRLSMFVSLALGVVCVLWGVLILMIPGSIGSALLGSTWTGARQVALPSALATAASGALVGAGIGLRAMLQVQRALRVRVIFSVLVVVSLVGGAAVAGAPGAAWASIVAYAIGATLMWVNLRQAMNQMELQPVGGDGPETPASPTAKAAPGTIP